LQYLEKISEGKGKDQDKKENFNMKNGDTIATVIAFLLVLPWLARLIASAKATWRAVTAGQNKKRDQAV